MNIKQIYFKNRKIEFSVCGKGNVIVLLHGYIESYSAWADLQKELCKDFTVLAINLPGHGNSEIIEPIQTMSQMADAVDEIVKSLNISRFTLIGHSMGGYVTLEYLSKYSEKLNSYCLFHSSPFADSDEKKTERDRIIELIRQGKKEQLAKQHVEKTFSAKNLEKFKDKIKELTKIAVNTSAEATISVLEGMKIRKNHYDTMLQKKLKSFWIIGKEDNFINFEQISRTKLPENCELIVLNDSGHQGYIEEFEKTTEIIRSQLNKA